MTIHDLHVIASTTGESADQVLSRLLSEMFEAGVAAVKAGDERRMISRAGNLAGILRDAEIGAKVPDVPSLIVSGPAAMERYADA